MQAAESAHHEHGLYPLHFAFFALQLKHATAALFLFADRRAS